MRFAAGLTISGIVGFLLLEALKLVMVPVTAWLIGFLALVLKVALVVLGLGMLATVIAVTVFVYRWFRRRAEVEA